MEDFGEWTSYTGPLLISAVGATTVQARVTDNAGNTGTEDLVVTVEIEPYKIADEPIGIARRSAGGEEETEVGIVDDREIGGVSNGGTVSNDPDGNPDTIAIL